MGFTSVKAIVLIQLLALVLGSFSELNFENLPLHNHQDNEMMSTSIKQPTKKGPTPIPIRPPPAKPAKSPPPAQTKTPPSSPPSQSPTPPTDYDGEPPIVDPIVKPTKSSQVAAKPRPPPKSPKSPSPAKPAKSPPPAGTKTPPSSSPPTTDYGDEPPIVEPPTLQ